MSHAGRPVGGRVVPYLQEEYESWSKTVIGQARELIHRVQEWFPQWFPPPFDPRIYAEMLGIPVIVAPLPIDLDAIYVPIGDRPRILLNEIIRSKGRRNFSLAHEVAHTFFPDTEGARYQLRTQNKALYSQDPDALLVERLCDLASGELLMPREWFLAALDRRGVSASSLVSVAAEFEVSLEAAAVRLVELGPSSYQVLFAEHDPVDSSLVVQKVFANGCIPRLFREGSRIPRSSFLNAVADAGHEMTAWQELRGLEGALRVQTSACSLRRAHTDGSTRVLGLGILHTF